MQQLISLDLEDSGLTIQSIIEFESYIHRFTSLEHLNLSNNRLIRLVPISFMNFAATLKSFIINFLLPPADHLNDAAGVRSDSMRNFLNFSDLGCICDNMKRCDADIVEQSLPNFSALKRLRISPTKLEVHSSTPQLFEDGVTAVAFLQILTGTCISFS